MPILIGDVRDVLDTLPERSVQCVVTSPPYWNLRDYGTGTWGGGDPDCDHKVRIDPKVESSTLGGGKKTTGHQHEGFNKQCPRCGAVRIDRQIGLEPTIAEYIDTIVGVFRKVWRVLRDDGTLWLNMGDSYNAGTSARRKSSANNDVGYWQEGGSMGDERVNARELKPKDLIGMPWRVALALQADGWYLRRDIIWHKPNPMPESAKDRPTTAHEYLFLLTKKPRYYYDAAAIDEPVTGGSHSRGKTGLGVKMPDGWATHPGGHGSFHRDGREKGQNRVRANPSFHSAVKGLVKRRNKRSVWTIPTQPFPDAHFATFPERLVEPCILAGSRPGDTVLDPFIGSGTVAVVAERHGREWIGIDLGYSDVSSKRIEAARTPKKKGAKKKRRPTDQQLAMEIPE